VFPTPQPAEIERLRRFGEVRTFAAAAVLRRVGEVGHTLNVVLSGAVEISQRHQAGLSTLIVTYGPGAFMGKLAQLAGRPALVDAHAREPVEVLVIPPERLRAMFVAEAEVGERIMRALILRRVGLLETGAGGPVIVGRTEHPDVLRLEGFVARNGHPRLKLDPETDAEAKALLDRFHVDPGQLPFVLCPGGQLLRNPSELELARCIGMLGPSIRSGSMISASSVLAPRISPPPSTRPPKASLPVARATDASTWQSSRTSKLRACATGLLASRESWLPDRKSLW
jgi:thioredoxin reductase (NADPH)